MAAGSRSRGQRSLTRERGSAGMKRTQPVLVDDIDGTPATETVRFGLDGCAYEIDLSADNATRLRLVFAPYLVSSRPIGDRPAGPPRPSPDHRSARRRRHGASRRAASRDAIPTDPVPAASPERPTASGSSERVRPGPVVPPSRGSGCPDRSRQTTHRELFAWLAAARHDLVDSLMREFGPPALALLTVFADRIREARRQRRQHRP
jgi:hypothetical protein